MNRRNFLRLAGTVTAAAAVGITPSFEGVEVAKTVNVSLTWEEAWREALRLHQIELENAFLFGTNFKPVE